MKTKAPPLKQARTRILIVDDHPIVRKGIADLVIVDLSLKGAGGLELLKDLKIRHPEIPALVLSMHDETLFAERALRAGARGYVMKQEAVNELEHAIRRVLSGKIYLSQAMSDRLLHMVSQGEKVRDRSPMERLSDRELEVFEMIGRGLPMREIAKELHLSVKTIETHRAHIKEKLSITSAVQLVQHATQWVHGR